MTAASLARAVGRFLAREGIGEIERRFRKRLRARSATPSRAQRLVAEFLGTAGLLAVIIGSGIMADTLSGGNDGVALIGCVAAIAAGLIVLIWIFGPVSGCHINPAVTLAFRLRGEIGTKDASLYWLAQFTGGVSGAIAAHAMFEQPLLQWATTVRTGPGQWLSEMVATFGLLLVIFACIRVRKEAVGVAVGLYIFAACWFTASTSFANPAVTLARSFSDTFCGIRPADAPAFIAVELFAALIATPFAAWLYRSDPSGGD